MASANSKSSFQCCKCKQTTDDNINCDSCLRWWCPGCVNQAVPGSFPDALCQALVGEFDWDCTDCGGDPLPDQLLRAGVFSLEELTGFACAVSPMNDGSSRGDRAERVSSVSVSPVSCPLPVERGTEREVQATGNECGAREMSELPGPSRQRTSSGSSETVKMMMLMLERQDKQRREDMATMEAHRRQDLATHREEVRLILDQFAQVSANMQSQISQSRPRDRAEGNVQQEPNMTSKLPKLSLPTFAGDRLEWLSFWESFDINVNSQTRLQDKQKLDYLYQVLSGPALDKIKGLGLQGNSYIEAISILKHEYGRQQDLIEARLKLLQDLPHVKESLANLEGFVDEVRATTTTLKKLGISDAALDVQVYLLFLKLPPNLQSEIKRMRMLRGTNDNEWTLCEFLRLLNDMKVLAPTRPVNAKARSTAPAVKERDDSATPTTASFLQATTKTQRSCIFCAKPDHFSDECTTVKDLTERRELVRKGKRCFRCLGTGHLAKDCKRTRKCFHCKESGHHSSLCSNRKSANIAQHFALPEEGEAASELAQFQTYLAGSNEMDGIIMATCAAKVVNPATNKSQTKHVYLDAGARYTCIDKSSADDLQLKPIRYVTLNTARFNSCQSEKVEAGVVELDLSGPHGFMLKMNAYTVKDMAPPLPLYPVRLSANCWKKVKGFKPMNTPPKRKTLMKIDILLGMDYWNALMGPNVCKTVAIDSNLTVYCTPLGAILAGNALQQRPKPSLLVHAMCCQTSRDVSDLWNLESIGVKDKQEVKEPEVVTRFKETTIYENGRYYVKWPWKSRFPEIATNFSTAKYRLQRTLDTLCVDSTKLGNFNDYDAIIKDQLDKGVIEPVEEAAEEATIIHYISHFPHIRSDRQTTKVRIVYDASARTKPHGVSLNDLMYTGVNYLEDLVGLPLRFRLSRIAITSDVEKAFLQVGLKKEDRDSTRFLWLKDPTKRSMIGNLQIYRFTRIPFGVVASPYLLGATINLLLDHHPSDTASRVRGNIYMDNVFVGANDFKEAWRLYEKGKHLFKKGSMNLREWLSNCPEFNQGLPEADRAKASTSKVLGVLWDVLADTFQVKYRPEVPVLPVTKRLILHGVAKAFDPLGLISPLTVKGRIMLQQLWKENREWDEDLSQELKEAHRVWFKARKGEVAREPVVGEVVILREITPRSSWKLARVVRILPGGDSLVCFVELKLPSGTLTRRGMRDIIPLEAEAGLGVSGQR